MNLLLGIVLFIWIVSAIGLVLSVLLHSGKGTGLSDIIAGSVYSNTSGSSIIQKNLDRWTVMFAIVFFITLLVLMLIYPHGTITPR